MFERVRDWLPMLMPVMFGLLELPNLVKRREGTQYADRGSFPLIMVVIGGTFFVGFWIAFDARFKALRYTPHLVWVGLAFFLLGAFVRGWAVRVLGKWFTPTVQTSRDQPIVELGPYKRIRHPAYTGAILEAFGMALATCNALSLVLITGAVAVSLGYRIHVEELALVKELGEPYRAYMARTKRLFPFLF